MPRGTLLLGSNANTLFLCQIPQLKKHVMWLEGIKHVTFETERESLTIDPT